MENKQKEFIHLGNRNRTLSRNKHYTRQKVVVVSPKAKPLLNIQNVIETQKTKRPKQSSSFAVVSTSKSSLEFKIERQNKTLIKQQITLGNSVRLTRPENNNQNIILTQRVFQPSYQRVYLSPTQKANRHSATQVLSPRMKQKIIEELSRPRVPQVSFLKRQQKTQPLEHQTQQLTQRQRQLLNKLRFAENRVAQLNGQKINIQANLTDQNIRLFHQNQHLKTLIQKFNRQQMTNHQQKITKDNAQQGTNINHAQQGSNINHAQQGSNYQQKIDESKQDLIDRLGEMEHMLQNQIFQSLHLRDQNQLLKKQLQDVQSQLLVQRTLFKTITQQSLLINTTKTQNGIQHLKHQLQKNDQKINPMQKTSKKLMVDDKDEIILELNRKIYAYELQFRKLSLIEQNKNKNASINDSNQNKQCHKCQQLMSTVLKLNTHLNKF